MYFGANSASNWPGGWVWTAGRCWASLAVSRTMTALNPQLQQRTTLKILQLNGMQ